MYVCMYVCMYMLIACHQRNIHQMIDFFSSSPYRSTKRFGLDGKRFEHLAFLNLAQNVVCLFWSYISEFLISFICFSFRAFFCLIL